MLLVAALSAILSVPSAAIRVNSQMGGAGPRHKMREVRQTAECGVLMTSVGESANEVAAKVAPYIRKIPAQKGWCPLDPELDHIPVALFSDLCDTTQLEGVQCRPETDMEPFEGKEGPLLQAGLGSWKIRWYHAQVLLKTPYTMSVYVDLDALPCSAEKLTEMMNTLLKEKAAIGMSVHDKHPCAMSHKQDCRNPHPSNLVSEAQIDEWANWTERNAGTIVLDKRVGMPYVEEFARVIKEKAGNPLVQGDQYAFREATFKYRHQLKEYHYDDDVICRHGARKWCSEGCSVSHLIQYRALKNGTGSNSGSAILPPHWMSLRDRTKLTNNFELSQPFLG